MSLTTHVDQALPTDIGVCEEVTHRGSRNPDSANFGPDEHCEADTEPGQSFCALHRPDRDDERDFEPWL